MNTTGFVKLGGQHILEGVDNVAIVDFDSTYKYANADEGILSFLNRYSPKDHCFYIRVINVAAGEYWGCNNNADYFPEKELMAESPNYGYTTFMHYAKVYRNHANKDPKNALGDVIYAAYNKDMHYVESVLEIDKFLADDVWANAQKGIMPATSMGTRVPYDVCSICGRKASKSTERCTHILFEKKKIYPDGRQVYMINVHPRFFDQSIVVRPADNIALGVEQVNPKGTNGVALSVNVDRAPVSRPRELIVPRAAYDEGTVKKVASLVGPVDVGPGFKKEMPSDEINGRVENIAEDPESLGGLVSIIGHLMKQKNPELDERTIEKLSHMDPLSAKVAFDVLGMFPNDSFPMSANNIFETNKQASLESMKQAIEDLSYETPKYSWAGHYGIERLEKIADDLEEPSLPNKTTLMDVLTPSLLALPFAVHTATPRVQAKVTVPLNSGMVEKTLKNMGLLPKGGASIDILRKKLTPFTPKGQLAMLAALGTGVLAYEAGNLGKMLARSKDTTKKTAALLNSWMAVVPGTWFASNYYKSKRDMGINPGPVGNFVASHPVMTGGLALAGLHGLGTHLGYNKAPKAGKALFSMFKGGGEDSDIMGALKFAGLIYSEKQAEDIERRYYGAWSRICNAVTKKLKYNK